MSTDESARFVRQARGTADQNVVEQLTADVRHLAVSYLKQPPYVLYGKISGLRGDVFRLLDQRQRPAILADLYRIAGQLCALLAHASLDLGQPYAAETHTRTAWLCADLAEDDQLRCYIRWVQSNIAFWDGDYREAAYIAGAGQEYASNGTALLRLASQQARAFAAASDHRAVESALSTATAARESVQLAGNEVGVFQFDFGKAAYYASEVRLAMGGEVNLRLGIEEAEHALSFYETIPASDRCAEFVAAAQIDRVSCHVALQDLDGAATRLQEVLKLPSANRTVPIAYRVKRVGSALSAQRFAGSAIAADLRAQIELFGAYTAVRELPQV